MARTDPVFNLRMPQEMKDQLTERAKGNGRSINAEILVILANAMLSEGGDDEWLSRLMKVIEKTEPDNEGDREKFALAVSEAIKEITRRIAKENIRLQAISDAQIKLSKKPT